MNSFNRSLIAVVPALLLAACGGGNDDNLDDRLDLADPKVRLVHAVPLAPDVSLFRNDVVVGGVTDVPYKGATNYFDVSTATQKWDLRTTGTPALTVGSLSFAAVGYKKALTVNGADSIQLEGGTYQLRMTPAGTKTVVFNAQVSLAKNADWLLVPVPASVTPNAAKVLVVQTDSSTPATELSTTP